jgi:hypothetical protein
MPRFNAAAFFVAALLTGPLAAQAIRPVVAGTRAYVDAARPAGSSDGRTWATAFASLPAALASGAAEIWVARGTYVPGAERTATFQLRPGVAVYGGFAGQEGRLEERDWHRHPTILDGQGVYHVVTGADDAVLDGFTVTGGNGLGADRAGPPGGKAGPEGGPMGGKAGGKFGGKAGGKGAGKGGSQIHVSPQAILAGSNPAAGAGLINFQAAPIVRNCVFEANRAGKGGAVYNMTITSFPPRPEGNAKVPVFVDCVFRRNFAQGRGGAVSNDLGTSPVFLNCVFEDNETPQKGGGMYNDFGCAPTLINCLFTGNRAQSAAGLGNDGGSSPVLYHCTFTKNHATDHGAPLYQGTGPASNPVLLHCTIVDNRCDWEDPGIYNWHGNTPVIRAAPDGDNGYRVGRFLAADLARLRAELEPHRPRGGREPAAAAPGSIPRSERIVYVAAGGPAAGDGRSWPTAYASLPAGIADAGRDGAEVRVAAGVYPLGPDRTASFVLQPGVRLYGGYAGTAEGGRDPVKYVTTLDGKGAYHVVIGADGAVLDGCTITGGRADGAGYDGQGGGLINYRRGPQGRPNSPVVTGFALTIHQCIFVGNYARDGGAVYSYDRAKPVFTACVFRDNQAENGGAVLDRVGVESTFTRCTFLGNTARWRGGATYFDYGSRPKFDACEFRANSTGGHGGAVYSVSRASQLENTIVTLTACRFEANRAQGRGGAAAFCDNSIGVEQQGIFAGNEAGLEGNDLYREPAAAPGRGPGAPGAGKR